jgi:NADPH:quinone reductase
MADMPQPSPGPGEVMVDVAFAGCNWADTQIRTGIYPHQFTYPVVLGLEFSGMVSKLGPGVSGVKVGDRVATFVEKGGAARRNPLRCRRRSHHPADDRLSHALHYS